MNARINSADFCGATTREARLALAERQLQRLAVHEATVRAFACHGRPDDLRRAVAAAAATGPLSGALIGVKDIITTAEYPTFYGSREGRASGPRQDAWAVAQARAHGGIILGKSVCTEFAIPVPGPTTNPHDPNRTPGGSSSGSGAAVAAGFVSFALGTQTAGSTIRPASFCGVVGFKPSFGLLPLTGVEAMSTTLDHLGIFARSPRDAWYFTSTLAFPEAEILAPRRPGRVLVLRIPHAIPQTDNYPQRIEALTTELARMGVEVESRDLPFPLDDFQNLQKQLCYWEAARILLAPSEAKPLPELLALLGPYLKQDPACYAEARRRRLAYQADFQALMAGFDAALLPAAVGAAPRSLADTGDAVMSRFWTALHVPAITVPLWTTADGAPLGLQLIGKLGDDRALCAVAQWFTDPGQPAGDWQWSN